MHGRSRLRPLTPPPPIPPPFPRTEYTIPNFELSTTRLLTNPETPTLWNHRKQFLKRNQHPQEIYNHEIQLTMECLYKNPKSYWTWHHRKWTINQMEVKPLEKELKLCAKLLAIDQRNFHCWNYRRYICQLANISVEEDLEFTTSKIKENFSNYSAWHHRSKIIKLEHNLQEELELVLSALYTEPNDQSAWFYHSWVLSQPCIDNATLLDQSSKLEELLELEPESKWPLLATLQILARLGTKKELIAERLEKLLEVDPLRRGYYEHLRDIVYR